MSEEKSPPLKLRSRARSEAGSAPAQDSPETAGVLTAASQAASDAPEAASPSGDKSLRVRSKPRLAPESSADAPALSQTAPPPPLTVHPEPGAEAESTPIPPQAEPLSEAFTGIQLQAASVLDAGSPPEVAPASPAISVPEQAADTAASPPAPPASSLLIGGMACEPMAMPSPRPSYFKAVPPKPIHIDFKEKPEKTEAPTPVRPEDRKVFKFGVVAAGTLAVIALGIGVFFAFKTFQALRIPRSARAAIPTTGVVSPPAERTAKVADNAAAAQPQASTAAHAPQQGAPASQAGRLIQAARNVAFRDESELNEVLASGAGAQSATSTATNTSPSPSADPALRTYNPSAVSPIFQAFADALRINGVFQGNPARASINGRIVREGAILDAALGVTFDGINPGSREIILKDPSGATIRRKY
ncbi:MAG: hypothetical protein HS122_06775 [Opitutaceae bacterium]|nr:hypothetical protein [Opitutaceae bacterium]